MLRNGVSTCNVPKNQPTVYHGSLATNTQFCHEGVMVHMFTYESKSL